MGGQVALGAAQPQQLPFLLLTDLLCPRLSPATRAQEGPAGALTRSLFLGLKLLGLENLVLQEALTHKKIIAKGEQVREELPAE